MKKIIPVFLASGLSLLGYAQKIKQDSLFRPA